jgi:hypothetical protein
VSFLKKLRISRGGEQAETAVPEEYPENMDSAYRKGAQDPEEEASMRTIQEIREKASNPDVSMSVGDKLDRLEKMRKEGLIDEAEYERIERELKK